MLSSNLILITYSYPFVSFGDETIAYIYVHVYKVIILKIVAFFNARCAAA